MSPAPGRNRASVIDLARVRGRKRLDQSEASLCAVMESNRRAMTQLFGSGLIFTRQGARAGRDLLLAYQHLLKVRDALGRIEELGEAPDPAGAESVYAELEALIQHSGALTHRTGDLLRGEIPVK